MTSTEELERPAWGVWVDYKIAPPGSYACLVSRFMDNRWTDPEPQWMPAQLRPQLHGEVRVMPYLMPNDPLAAVNALPELLERVRRLEEALKPFAEIAQYDIGNSEANDDLFRPMMFNNRGPLLTVGMFRRARAALKETGHE